MNHRRIAIDRILLLFIAGLFILYLAGIFWINLHSNPWYNYDIYADAMIAKYMAEEHTLFPADWTFGNQFYVSATPVVAALFYHICSDTVLSLGLASCVMTVLLLWSFIWCLKPFAKKESILAGLLCLIGGAIFSLSATTDTEGLQLFYTMGSYYSCYIIGIFLTLGIWLRLYSEQKVPYILYGISFVLNLTLGMQSLREMLVLNMPLCALVVFLLFVSFIQRTKDRLFTKDRIFAAAMFVANAMGYVLIKLLIQEIPIHQYTILQGVRASIPENMTAALRAFLSYIGILPSASKGGFISMMCTLGSIAIVGYAAFSVIKSRKFTPFFCLIGFCFISLAAVFCAGTVKISTRPIYYFVWYLLVSLSFIYTAEQLSDRKVLHRVFLIGLILISVINGYFHFHNVFSNYDGTHKFYQKIVQTLQDEGITHIYYEEDTLFEAPSIAAHSNDTILCGAFFLHKDQADTDDLLTYITYLCSREWFQLDNITNAYVLLSGERLKTLETKEFESFRDALFSHLTFRHRFTYQDKDYYLYSFDNHLYQDLLQ